MVSIGLGGGEVVLVDAPLDKVRRDFQRALVRQTFVKIVTPEGETVFVNPAQMKVLQRG